MKKLLNLNSSKIYLACAMGLLMTLGAFWHHQMNQTQLDKMNVLNQGIGTCFNRLSQTFTALMIKDVQSPYLNRGFMGLSNECLSETIKGINPFKKNVGKGYETLNQLISEVHWFHEKVFKIHNPLLPNQKINTPLAPLADRYGKMESFKINLIDEIDATSAQIREIQINDEVVMGAGLIIFVIALSLLSLQEFNRMQLKREVEREALNFLKAGNANVGAIVDRLVDRALMTQKMPVTAQIFRDYHGDLLERISVKATIDPESSHTKAGNEFAEASESVATYSGHRTSLKEILVSIQKIQPKDSIHMAEIRDVQLNICYETFEQMLNAAITQLSSRRLENKKVMISNQIHSDRSVVNLFIGGATFTVSELEFAESSKNAMAEGLDMNLIILKEMVGESGAQWHLENKADRNGNITGMNIRFSINRSPKESRKNLVSVIKGKKKDLARELMN
jgi:hypothetical protein